MYLFYGMMKLPENGAIYIYKGIMARRRATKRKKRKKKWIKGAIRRPGALRAKAKRAGALGPDGKIKMSWLRAKAKGKDQTAKQARLAITMRSFKKKKKRKSGRKR